jgi:hypothetical protein
MCVWAFAQEGEPEGQERDQLIRQLDRLQQQMGAADEAQAHALEQQIDQARGRLEELEREQQFREIRGGQRARVWEIEMEIAEIRRHLEGEGAEMPKVHRDLAGGRLAYLEKVRDLCKQIATLPGPEAMPKAFAVLEQIETAEMRWRLVDSPKLEGAAQIHEMEQVAARFDNPPELLVEIEKVKVQREALISDAENLFALWTKHRQMSEDTQKAVEGFWGKVDQAQAGPERLP